MNYTNILDLPAPFVDAAKSDHVTTPNRYSVTQLLKGTCETTLFRRHEDEITRDVSENVWLIFGTAVHKILEQGEETATQLKEGWLSTPVVDGYEMSGIFDLYDDETGTVTDWKTASVWKPIFGDWEDYRKQLLYYVVLFRANGFLKAHRGEIVALLKDHSSTEFKRKNMKGEYYPPKPVYRIGWDFTEDEIEAAKVEIKEKFKAIIAAKDVPDSELEPCTPKERWEKPPKFAVMKEGNKRAVKLYDDEAEALDAAEELTANDPKKKKYHVEYRPGECRKCIDYCDVTEWCPFYQKEVINNEE